MAVQIIDYPTLLAAGADWLNRADLTDQLPAFVALSETQFNRDLRVRDMMVRASTTSNLENVDLPADWLEHYSLVVAPGGTPGPPLRYISEKESNNVKAEAIMTWDGNPFGYTIIGNSIELVPTPANDVDLRMVYYARIPSLSATTPVNWLITKSPDLYLYSTLMQAAPYLKDDDRLQTWMQLRAALVEGIRLESEAALRPRSGFVARPRVSF
jgi:hypothetical protein